MNGHDEAQAQAGEVTLEPSTAPDPELGAPAPVAPASGVPEADVERRRLFRWFFFGVFAFLLYQLLLILSLFSDAIIWAASLTLVCFPIHRFIARHLDARPNLAAVASTLAVLLLVLVPTLAITWVAVEQSAELYPTVRAWFLALQSADSAWFADLVPDFVQRNWARLQALLDFGGERLAWDLEELMLASINAASAQIANFGAGVARNVLLGFLNLLGILVLMFFCFRDGQRFLGWLFAIVPMPTVHVESIAFRIYETVTAVIRGALLTAAMQGVLAVIGYQIAGVPLAVFFGVLTGLCAMIPVVGAGLVWAPIGVFVFVREPAWGVFVFAWGFFVVSLADNVLKPLLIGTRARMPILLIFCGIIGGVNVYGVTGLIIGPILMASLLAFVSIYREHYSPDNGSGGTGQPVPESSAGNEQ